MEDNLIKDILNYIEANLYDSISLDAIANKMHFNRFYIMRLFKKNTGLTIIEYINQRKIIKSIKQVVTTNERILKIALDNGYHSLEYYSEMFYKVTGFSPLQLRNSDNNISLISDDKDLYQALISNQEILNKLKNMNVKSKTKVLSKKQILQKRH